MDELFGFTIVYLFLGYLWVPVESNNYHTYNDVLKVFLGWPYFVVRDIYNLIKKINENARKNM